VTGVYEPVAIDEVDRSVSVLLVKGSSCYRTVDRFLRSIPRSTCASGAERATGRSFDRGGTFGQTLIVVDGQRMNDASRPSQHGPATAARIDLANRSAAGVGLDHVWIGRHRRRGQLVTRRPEASEFRLRTALGNFGVNQQRGSLASCMGADRAAQFSIREFYRPGIRADRISQSCL